MCVFRFELIKNGDYITMGNFSDKMEKLSNQILQVIEKLNNQGSVKNDRNYEIVDSAYKRNMSELASMVQTAVNAAHDAAMSAQQAANATITSRNANPELIGQQQNARMASSIQSVLGNSSASNNRNYVEQSQNRTVTTAKPTSDYMLLQTVLSTSKEAVAAANNAVAIASSVKADVQTLIQQVNHIAQTQSHMQNLLIARTAEFENL